MKTSKKLTRNMLLAALLIGAGVLVWLCLPRQRLLLQWATRIVPVNGPSFVNLSRSAPNVSRQTGRKLAIYDPYFWLSDRKVVFLHAVKPTQAEAIAVDTHTGAKTLLPIGKELGSWLGIYGITLGGGHRLTTQVGGDYAVSPDGKWLLCSAQGLRSSDIGQKGYVALALDGSRRLTGPQSGFPVVPSGFPVWLRDSRHWIEEEHGPKGDFLLVQSLDAPGKTQRIAVSARLDGTALGVTPSGALLVGAGADFLTGKMDISEITLPSSLPLTGQVQTALQRPLSVPWPPLDHVDITEIPDPIVSPQGDRLAWLVIGDSVPTHTPWLQRLFGYLNQHPQTLVSLWVSRVDGSDMQEIGHMPFKQNEEIPQHLKWTPDGKRLSFLYKDALYTVPVDDGR